MEAIEYIDSHTGGEPTRVVLEGPVNLPGQTMEERVERLGQEFGSLWKGIVREPRGSEVLVGAVLTPPVRPTSLCGVIFFNTAGMLGMCGHGTIGVVETLRHVGRIGPGRFEIDTPVGTVAVELFPSGEVAITNVISRRTERSIKLLVAGVGEVTGDVAYGGNWFFIVREPLFDIDLNYTERLTELGWAVRRALAVRGICGDKGEEIDHIELFGSPPEYADSINFVLCPGGAYDRSPCGTGTSAKMACLFADGLLAEGQEYRQASITGSVFRGSVAAGSGGVVPTIVGRAFVTAVGRLVFHPDDPLRWGA